MFAFMMVLAVVLAPLFGIRSQRRPAGRYHRHAFRRRQWEF